MAQGEKVVRKKKPAVAKAKRNSLLRTVFTGCGFGEIKSENIEFVFKGDASEFDYIFVFNNLVVICEETEGAKRGSDHFRKKQTFATLLSSDLTKALEEYSRLNKNFSSYLEDQELEVDDLEVRFLYYSCEKEQEAANTGPYKILKIETAKYFEETIKTIGGSARYELLKYLDVKLSQLGDQRIKGRPDKPAEDTFDAFILSGKQTNYPEGFYVVSFYADPESLIERAYVLRRHGWESPEISYQRMLSNKKLKEMRMHLSSDEKVYVNNLVITLPSDMVVYEAKDGTKKQVDFHDITTVKPVVINLPKELASIGIIDGQHRIYSYHEGVDQSESKIRKIRKRQNLLVTGIVFPDNYTDKERVRFEAELFLKINNTQTAVSSGLRQEIETLVNPLSGLAIAKAVADQLSKHSAIKGVLKTSVFDRSSRIPTASIVRYILKPLVDPESKGSNELFKLWACKNPVPLTDSFRDEYVKFCKQIINEMLVGVKQNLTSEQWAPKNPKNKGVLSPTFINGLLVCLRELISNDKIYYDDGGGLISPDYQKAFSNIASFRLRAYTSSRWAELGRELYSAYFK
ncbi:DGQHR domain-containing protein [Halomonas sp. E14]|uniref:DGQHR domain-containing protein n=1 Tax=Halomonas sp. E14 TaxID=3397245 RepID=UPI00403E94C0